jgi:MtN3 and saliva related transmembrane protein
MTEPIWMEILGTVAGLLTTFSGLPQLLTTYRTRDVQSLDLRFLVMLFVGLFLWMIYGLWIDSIPVAIFNAIGCVLWLPIVVMKIRNKAFRLKSEIE